MPKNDLTALQKHLNLIWYLGEYSFGRSVEEIAEYLDISRRSVFRYINALEALGFIVDRNDGTYRIMVKNDKLKTLHALQYFNENDLEVIRQIIDQLHHPDGYGKKQNLIYRLETLYDFQRLAISMHSPADARKLKMLQQGLSQQKKGTN